MTPDPWSLTGMVAIAGATLAIGLWAVRSARTTTDPSAARRLVPAERNAAAISGEFLSAASFLGVAGLVVKEGADALWYPVGFAAGYLALLLFVAAPMRRSGAYTLPDFAEARLDSPRLRRVCTAFVVLAGLMYLVPQLQGAGSTLAAATGLRFAAALAVVVAVVVTSVLTGGMRAITVVQAFQYWVKLFAVTLPAFALFVVFLGARADVPQELDAPAPPVFEHATTVSVDTDVLLRVTAPARLEQRTGGQVSTVQLQPGEHEISAGSELRFPAGSPAPVVLGAEATNAEWLRPFSGGAGELVETYSLLVATFFGTMGLPHVLARFYANPNGHAARRTALYVLALLAAFYLFPAVFGLLSRLYVPQLLVTGRTDAAVLLLPQAMLDNWVGGLLAAVTGAGAFAAFLSTSTGLVVSLAGVLAVDVVPERFRDVRSMAVAACLVAALVALVVGGQDLVRSVGMAFALAASTFGPVLVLGVWWRGLTAAGALSGMVTGGVLVLVSLVAHVLAGAGAEVWWSALLGQPALVTVPLAFAVTWAVSAATRGRVPPRAGRVMLRLHAPDRLGFHEREPGPRHDAQVPRRGGRHHRE
ncbi:sodium/solute symporter [Salinifilum ghardaiensis]